MNVASATYDRKDRLGAYALFAALLSAAGLPLYIHAPKFFVDEYGVSLAALGAALFGLRLLDVVQDPLFGRLSETLRHHRALAVSVAIAILGAAMLGLFAVTPPIAPLWWFAAMLTLVFSSYSFLTINFYAQGVTKAEGLAGNPARPRNGHGDGHGHLRLARWRETGALLGVCLAAIAPVALANLTDKPFAGFALGFAIVALLAMVAMRQEWDTDRIAPSSGFAVVLRDRIARRLLIVAFLNAAPVAVSSTLFLFFVESRLQGPGWEGPLLLVFFLSAAIAAPVWGRLAERFGARPVLLGGMVLSVLAFGWAYALGAGDVAKFALICIASGAALGADMTLLPALFATRMARVAPSAAEAFGLWSFVSKFTLAFAAVLLLPALEAAGFAAGRANSPEALSLLSLFYAAVPCGLKVTAILVLATTNMKET